MICNCASRGHALDCPVHTQADYVAQQDPAAAIWAAGVEAEAELLALRSACWGEPMRFQSNAFGWDFTTRVCRACHGYEPADGMPEGWDGRGHDADCWFDRALSGQAVTLIGIDLAAPGVESWTVRGDAAKADREPAE